MMLMVVGAVLLIHMAVVMLVAALIAVLMTAVMVMMVVMLMIVVAATALALFVVMVMMLMVMVTAAALLIMVMMMVVMMLMLLLQLGKVGSQCCIAFHGLDQLLAGELCPVGGDQGSLVIALTDQLHSGIQLVLGHILAPGQDDGGSGLDLVIVELTEVLHVDLDLACIGNSNGVAQLHIMTHDLLHCADDIGQLAHTGGLNDDPVGMELRDHLLQRLAEVANQTAADAAGVHLGDVDAGIAQEAAVDADLAKFVLDENQLLALIAFRDHFLDQSGLACTEEATVNINFCHSKHPLLNNSPDIIAPKPENNKYSQGYFTFSSSINSAARPPDSDKPHR